MTHPTVRRKEGRTRRARELALQGLTVREISEDLGVTKRHVWIYLKGSGIKARSGAAPPQRHLNKDGYVNFGGDLEHRLVAAEMIGRPLRREEDVHHINGDPSDNRPENLEVLSRSEHIRRHRFIVTDAEVRELLLLGHSYKTIAIRCRTSEHRVQRVRRSIHPPLTTLLSRKGPRGNPIWRAA